MSSQNLTVRDLAGDLENWMSLLPPQLRQTSIINIAIPGRDDLCIYLLKVNKLIRDFRYFLKIWQR